jgi:hypothetical protein
VANRVSLKDRRAGEAKGVDALIPGPATDPINNSTPLRQQSQGRPDLSKVTLYVRPDQVFAIESIQLSQRERTGKRPDKSDLVQEALDLLIQHYSQR